MGNKGQIHAEVSRTSLIISAGGPETYMCRNLGFPYLFNIPHYDSRMKSAINIDDFKPCLGINLYSVHTIVHTR